MGETTAAGTLTIEWACKCIVMRQFIDFRGKEFDTAHTGIRKTITEDGDFAEMWRHIDRISAGEYDWKKKAFK